MNILLLHYTYGDRVHYHEDIDNFDYIYESESLITLTGKKLHAKKNHDETM